LRSYITLFGAVLALVISFLIFTNFPAANRPYTILRGFFSEISGIALKIFDMPMRRVREYYDLYIDVIHAKKEVIELRKKMDALYLECARLREMERENIKLRKILELSEKNTYRMTVAQVVGEDVKSWHKCIIIDKGTDSGIRERMAVISPRGLVGQVMEANRKSSKIMVINDTNSAIDVYVEGKEIRGIAEGSGFSTLKLKYVKKNEEPEIGDRLITSGKDGIYPKGIPLGIVVNVDRKKGGIFLDIDVVPFANYRVLDQVIVLRK